MNMRNLWPVAFSSSRLFSPEPVRLNRPLDHRSTRNGGLWRTRA